MCFVDTSALHAVLDGADLNHVSADATPRRRRAERASPITTNYVVVELFALAQVRIGMEAVRAASGSVVVIGVGGGGLNAVPGAVLAGAGTIVALDPLEAKRAAARRFGADPIFVFVHDG